MNKIWLEEYPANVPHELDYSQYKSLNDIFEESFAKNAKRAVFKMMGKSISYQELDQYSAQVGAYLQSLGLEPGDRVAIMMPNVLQNPISIAAVLRAGFVVVNVNPLYTARELEHQLKDSGAKVIFILENFASVLQEVLEQVPVEHVIVTSMGDMLPFVKRLLVNFVVKRIKKLVPKWTISKHQTYLEVLKIGATKKLIKPALTGNDVAFLQYTGGTTGVSKGATLLHRNIIANILQTEAWLMPALEGKNIEQLTFVCALPLYHIFALTVCFMMGTRLGAVNILVPNPRDIPGFIKLLKQNPQFNVFPAVNTLYNALLNNPEFANLDFSNLFISNGGGMAVQRTVAEKWLAVTGCPIAEGYGLSETSPVATSNVPTLKVYSGNIGLPIPDTEVIILDNDEKEVPPGTVGEICIRGPQVMAGYWNKTAETAKAITPEGFFKSGDLGYMDEKGYFKIVDRKKDMILVSGFNVYPNEIEEVMSTMPGIVETAAVGVPDEHSGEVVKLFVVRSDMSITQEQVQQFCKEQFTNYKRPKYVIFMTDLPKTNVGKILRRQLRDL
ncbi:MAG: long-chain-fatty-acid--CoA ligase [Betaproteobacteria bacterium]